MGLKTWEMKIADRTFRFKMKKDSAEAVGRRIRDAVALRQFCRELGTYSTGEDYSSTHMVLFGLSDTPIKDPEAWQADLNAALDKYAGILIMDRPETPNAGTCLGEFMAIFEKHVPVKDNRKNAEQRAAEKMEREARENDRKAKEKADLEAYLSKFSTGPDAERIDVPSGKMAIYLETVYDNSDGMTDYYDPHRQVGVDLLLAIVPKQAKTQALARMAVGRYPDLAGVTFSWHTENYSMGKGNYLEAKDSWVDVPQPGSEEPRSCRYTVKFNEFGCKLYPYKGYPGNVVQSPGADVSAPVSNGSATISRNTAKDGIEIRFSARPADSIISRLKSNRWRWSRFSKCWYTRYSETAQEFAAELVKSLQTVTQDLRDTIAETSEPPGAGYDEITAEDMSAITGQEWTEEAMEQFKACC